MMRALWWLRGFGGSVTPQDGVPTEKSRRSFRILRIGAAIVIFLVPLLLWTTRHSLWRYLHDNPGRLAEVLAGGVVGSLVASLILTSFDNSIWAGDVDKVKEELEKVSGALAGLTSDLSAVRSDYSSLLEQLPSALGGEFTSSVLAFYPRTSRRIASILGEEARVSYARHFERVAVTEATDSYKVEGLEHILVDGIVHPVWRLRFIVGWEWLNDSQVSRTPLDGFSIVVTAPDEAMESLRRYKSRAEQDLLQRRFAEFTSKQNYVRSIIGHPAESEKLLSQTDAGLFFDVDEIRYKVDGGSEEILSAEHLVRVPHGDLPPLAYSAYTLPSGARRTALDVGKTMWVEYRGLVMIPAIPMDAFNPDSPAGVDHSGNGDGTRFIGTMLFPPSDVVAKSYIIQLVYPKRVDLNTGSIKVRIDGERSGCVRRYVWDPKSILREVNRRESLPGELQPGDNDGLAQMEVSGPLTDLCRINVVWHGSKIAAPEGKELSSLQ